MNAEQLLAHYERVADAPDAVANLRRFVLDLAVRGKLIEQELSDGTAADALSIIAAPGVSKRKGDAATPRSEGPFAIPPNWAWVRFSAIADFSAGRTPPRHDSSFWNTGDHPWVSIADMVDGELLAATKETVSEAARKHVFKAEPALPGTMIMSFKLTIGKIARLAVAAYHNEAIISIKPKLTEFDLYLFKVLPMFARQGDTKGAIKGSTLNRDSISNILIPLPPIKEQRRIVNKVDELMALCDQLEAARTEREARRDRLAAASLARLNAPDPETFAADARFALDALPSLTARADQIKQLRQAILNLAVRGKLVQQVASEEPVAIPDGLKPFGTQVPGTWRTVALESLLSEGTRNGCARRPDEAKDGVPILRISAGTVRQDGIVAEEEHKLISGIDEFTRQQYGLRLGDLLACRFNGNKAFVGRLTLFTDYLGLDPIYPDKLIRVRVDPKRGMPEFIRLAGESDLVRKSVEERCATTVGNWGISASSLKEVVFPVPPLAEQRRIVAKIDELMALCDQLEASLASANDTRRRLLDALLAEALQPALQAAA